MDNTFVVSVIMFIYLLYHRAEAGCANALGPCIGGECPDQADAGAQYTCISDTCCPQSATSSTCVDSAMNCQMFLTYCRQQPYVWCMATHCPRSCKYCT